MYAVVVVSVFVWVPVLVAVARVIVFVSRYISGGMRILFAPIPRGPVISSLRDVRVAGEVLVCVKGFELAVYVLVLASVFLCVSVSTHTYSLLIMLSLGDL